MPGSSSHAIEPTPSFCFGAREVRLTNLNKLFWKKLKITKRDLLQYYADVSPWLLPHTSTGPWS